MAPNQVTERQKALEDTLRALAAYRNGLERLARWSMTEEYASSLMQMKAWGNTSLILLSAMSGNPLESQKESDYLRIIGAPADLMGMGDDDDDEE